MLCRQNLLYNVGTNKHTLCILHTAKIGKCLGQELHLSLVQIQNLKKKEIKAVVMKLNLIMNQKTKLKAENLKIGKYSMFLV